MDLMDFIFPKRCHLCGAAVQGAGLCPVCRARLPRTRYHTMPMNEMEQRFAGRFPFERASGHIFYSSGSDLSVLMQNLKYRGFKGLARELGGMMGEELAFTGFLSDVDCIVPVPIHFFKKALRGYNQSEEIARGAGEALGLPVITALKAVRWHRTQTALTREQRIRNTTGIYRVAKGFDLSGRHILLLDDVCTTGATMAAAAEALLAAAPTARLTLLSLGVTITR